MSRASILMILGILVMLTPFLGLPPSIRSSLTVILGACVLGIGFALRVRSGRPVKPSTEYTSS